VGAEDQPRPGEHGAVPEDGLNGQLGAPLVPRVIGVGIVR